MEQYRVQTGAWIASGVSEWNELGANHLLTWDRAWREFEESRRRADAYQREIREQWERPVATLGRWGWTLAMWETFDVAEDLVSRYHSNTIDEYFREKYAESKGARAQEVFENIFREPGIARRWLPVIAQMREGFFAGHHLLVVPAGLAVIEGMVEAAADNLHRRSNPIRSSGTALDDTSNASGWLVHVSINAFVRALFGSHDFAAQPPARINRHWVLHGRSAPTRGQLESLRLLQAIDAINVVFWQ